MSVDEILGLLLGRLNGTNWAGSQFGPTVGGIESMLQRDLDRALKEYKSLGDTPELKQVIATFQAYGKLTDSEYEQIMEVLDGEK